MKNRTKFSVCTSIFLAGGAFTAAAQREPAPAAEPHRFHVEVSAATHGYQVISGLFVDRAGIYPLWVAAGYRLSPKWRVQLGAGRCNPAPYDRAGSLVEDGKQVVASAYYARRSQVLSSQLRRTLTKRPASNWQVEATAGVSVLDFEYKERWFMSVDGVTTRDDGYRVRTVNAYLALGLGLRRRFGAHWQAVADLGHAFNFAGIAEGMGPGTYLANVGVQYHFK